MYISKRFHEHKKVNTKIDFIKSEHDVLDFWKENLIFEKRRELNKGKKNGALSTAQLPLTIQWVFIMLGKVPKRYLQPI